MKFTLKGASKPVEAFPQDVKISTTEQSAGVDILISSSNFDRNCLATVKQDGSIILHKVDAWVGKVIPVSAEGYVKTFFNNRELKVS